MLDTSAVIALIERKHAGVRELVNAQSELPSVSIITVGELEHGLETALDDVQRRRRMWTLQACDKMAVVDIDRATARLYGGLSAQVPRRVGCADRWIVACAMRAGAALVTFDSALADALAQRPTSPDHPPITMILLDT